MTLPLISIFLPLIKVSQELNEVISKVFLGLVIILSFNLVIRNRYYGKVIKVDYPANPRCTRNVS